MANAEGYVLPKPGIPKTLGILNVIFGVLLLLVGICGGVITLAAPAIMKFSENILKEAQAKVEAKQKEELKKLDDREKVAKTEEEKKAITQERADIEAQKANMPKVDMSAATDTLNNPTLMGFAYLNLAIGLILNVLLLVSGILLIRLSTAGRSLAFGWAGLQVLATVILTAVSIAVIQPINKPNTDKQIAKLEADARGKPPGSPQVTTLRLTKFLAAQSIPLAVGQGVASVTYPAILLILLNTAGARAALLGKKLEKTEEF